MSMPELIILLFEEVRQEFTRFTGFQTFAITYVIGDWLLCSNFACILTNQH